MGTIKIIRKSQMANRYRKINLYINNEWVCHIAHGEERILELAPGKYNIKAKIDWTGSETVLVEVNENGHQEIEVGCNVKQSIPQIIFTSISLIILFGSLYLYGELKLGTWLVLIGLWFVRDVVLTRGKSFLYYLTVGRDKYLYLKALPS